MSDTKTATKNLPTLHAERDPDYVYVIYIRAARDAVWAALTDNKTQRSWWVGTRMNSTFMPGDSLAFEKKGGVDVRGVILDREEPSRLSYTFHVEGPGPQHDEGPTVVEYQLEQYEDTTKLTVTHSNLKKGGRVRGAISGGWPIVLSGLKTFLEGGKPLQIAPR
jgi:uncharacterized protein YndB with AHSA1/START domain